MSYISIRGAKVHNLKNITLDIPRNKLVVFTGVSGSGKSSLVFDTLFAEAQIQYLESLSTYARKRMPKFSRPDVEEINGISPAVLLDQRKLGKNPRSTVGTATEIYTYLRLLFSRCGEPTTIVGAKLFSFNNPLGACSECKGLGEKLILDKDKLLNWDLSLNEGSIRYSEYRVGGRRWNILRASKMFDMNKPLKLFTNKELNRLLYSRRIELNDKDERGFVQNYSFEGVVTGIKRRRIDKRGTSNFSQHQYSKFFELAPCDLCNGSRLNDLASSVKVNGKTIGELSSMPLTELSKFLFSVHHNLAGPIIERVKALLAQLIDIGVGYLSLNRPVATLSGGESQRVRLARQLGSNLIRLLYILDEPTVGLHQKDIASLIKVLKKIRDKGNSVLVVEHDPAVINASDFIVDMGPEAGIKGGKIVFTGTPDKLNKSSSLTGKYLFGPKKTTKKFYRKPKDWIWIKEANLHNLKNISVQIPTNIFVCVTGVAGSGKSSLIIDTFAKARPDVIAVDQSPIGRTPRSNSATYIGVFDLIRKVFARETGQKLSLFSFNSYGGCSRCRGLGYEKVEMHFLDDILIKCEECNGYRYTKEALKFRYKNKNIAEVLTMTVNEALCFFEISEIRRRLKLLEDVGLGYLELGQSLDTLSGGETQRIKLVSELQKKGNIYILDEPTTGLHMADIEKLLEILNRLVDSGNTVIVIEHNLDVISNADWIIDLGLEGGDQGGKIIAAGTPKELTKVKNSYTGQFLAKFLSS